MKVTFELDEGDSLEDLLYGSDLANTLVDKVAHHDPDFWAEKMANHLPSALGKYDLREILTNLLKRQLSKINVEKIVTDIVERELEDIIKEKVKKLMKD